MLSLLGMGGSFASSEPEVEFAAAQYAGNPAGQGADSHAEEVGYGAGIGDGPDRASPLAYKEWIPVIPARIEENRLSPEQRRALRHEINEAGRELYRPR